MGNKQYHLICNSTKFGQIQELKMEKMAEEIKKENKKQEWLMSKSMFYLYCKEIDQIIKLQAFFKGFLTRKRIRENAHIKIQKYKKVNWSNILENCNNIVKVIEKTLPPFDFSQYELNDKEELIDKPPYELDGNSIYIGQWDKKKGYRHGKGVQIFQDGSKYEGYWRKDNVEGYGRMIHSDGSIYEGFWINGKANGFGKFMSNRGCIYSGYWEDNIPNGVGIEIGENNSKYEGNYLNGKRNGEGKLTLPNGDTYEGFFQENRFKGQGKYIWNNNKIYTGEWENDQMNGFGIFSWPDGKKYEGEYRENKKHGSGKLTCQDGTIYIGNWVDGKLEGEGTIINQQGISSRAIWVNDLISISSTSSETNQNQKQSNDESN